MLLRTPSSPSLTSWFHQQNPKPLPPQEQPDFIHRNPKPPIITFHSPTPSTDPPKKLPRSSSDGNLVNLSHPLYRLCGYVDGFAELDEIEGCDLMFSSSGLDVMEVMVAGTGGGGGGGKICGGGCGGCGGGGGGCGGDGVDGYYRSMIESDPNNPTVLGNYAKYLKEVKGDVFKAEEYCSRAILANPSDGTSLSMYADLIWETQKDASRAQSYFDQAVKTSPNDSYVMAAYARFLWDADEEASDMNLAAPSFVHEASQQFPVAAVS